MAYIPGSLTQGATKTTGYIPGSLTQNTAKKTNYIPGSLTSGGNTARPDTKSSDGLYNLAVQNGLQGQADRILESQAGESHNKYFSGGFISDTFDVLNTLQYGVAGMLKGKSFLEGIKTRQSFSDKDALGEYGLPGVIGGIALDIAVDPLTYISPFTALRKIPGVAKAGTALKNIIFGSKVTKAIDTGGDIAKTYQATKGGTAVGKYLAQKFKWMAGADPVFKETFERGLKNTAISNDKIVQM